MSRRGFALVYALTALALKQGFGRLIRTKTDRGAVAVLDSRIMTKGYGKWFLRSIPKCRITDEREEFGKFFEGLRKDQPSL